MSKRSKALKASDIIKDQNDLEIQRWKRHAEAEKRRSQNLTKALERTRELIDAQTKLPKPRKINKGKAAKHLIRVIIPDSHGNHIDPQARDAFLRDVGLLNHADEVVWLGDHLDCGGTFSSHQRNYTHEMTESYADDVAQANAFIDAVQKKLPNARHHYIYGNHEWHIERWAARNFESFPDAKLVVDCIGPAAVLQLKQRGFKWYLPSERYHGLSVPGTIKLGKCHFTHGMSHAKHASHAHISKVGGNIVFGHVHRMQSVAERNLQTAAMGAWCPGTLAKLQPLYRHTSPTDWQHGYAVQFVNSRSGRFVHWNIPIVPNESLLHNAIDAVQRGKK